MSNHQSAFQLSRISQFSRITPISENPTFIESMPKIQRIEITTGKYRKKFTAIGVVTIRYKQISQYRNAVCSYGHASSLTDAKTNYVDLSESEQIESITTFRNFTGDFLCGIVIKTTTATKFGAFGVRSKMFNVIKSPYKKGYFISSIFATFDDVIRDLQANFSSTYASPFILSAVRRRKGSIDSNRESSEESFDNSIGEDEVTELLSDWKIQKGCKKSKKFSFHIKKVAPMPPPRLGSQLTNRHWH